MAMEGTNVVRRERTLRLLQRTRDGIKDWLAHRHKSDVDAEKRYVGRHERQREALSTILLGAADQLLREAREADPTAPVGEFFDGCRLFDEAAVWLARVWEFYRDRFDQRDDPAFGPVVGFGLGGEAAELLGDRAWRPVPLTDRDAFSLVRAPKAAPLLTGYRGSAPVDLDALADLVLRIGQLVDEQPTLSSLVLNPVLARPEGISVLHASVAFVDAPARPDTGPRRL
jgi:hypothetical protein